MRTPTPASFKQRKYYPPVGSCADLIAYLCKQNASRIDDIDMHNKAICHLTKEVGELKRRIHKLETKGEL